MSGPTQSSHTRGGSQATQHSGRRISSGSSGNNPTQDTAMTEVAERNLVIQADVIATFLKRIVNCRSVAQLVALVPAIAQDRTKVGLDEIVTAHIKKAMAASLLAEWRDSLAKENYDSILELKSIRAPSIQISKLAEKEGSINKDFQERKGQRGAGPSKTKNQKNTNKIGKKDRKRKNRKRGTSSTKQQKKR
ncbi:hypothetical protein DDE83_009198 [Stemphylium lycopersici]|uniref:Uncharacterized protein n=1 Tax=Stemphylium lycopersici TaxID=183478 RepID=A0A364MR96_STELY|nr:hypothetical protein DDE83_009198 [Stemphylium lycopersici]